MAQLVRHQPLNLEVVGLSLTLDNFFYMFVPLSAYTVGAEFLSRLRLRGQLQYRTALNIIVLDNTVKREQPFNIIVSGIN